MEIEEAKEKCKMLGIYIKNTVSEEYKIATETVLQALENSIPKQTLKDKIKDLKEQYKKALEENSTKAFILKCQIEILQELLEGK